MNTSFSRYACLLVLVPFLLMSCTSGKPAPADKPSGDGVQSTGPITGAYELEITPHDPTRKSTLNLTARGFTLSEAEIMWYINEGMVLGSGWNQVAASEAKRGDTIFARALFHGQEIRSNVVRIGNTPPSIAFVRLVPAVFKPGDKLRVEATGRDDDGDTVTFRYAWLLNRAPAGTGDSLERPFKRGDKISVTVTPFDGQDQGEAVFIEHDIQNTPPVVIEHNEFKFDGTTYTYQVRAVDADGDTLTYGIDSPEDGMTIDTANGLFTWKVPAEFTGSKNVTIKVADGHGGTASYVLTVAIQ